MTTNRLPWLFTLVSGGSLQLPPDLQAQWWRGLARSRHPEGIALQSLFQH